MPEVLIIIALACIIIGLSAWAADKWWAATHPKPAEDTHEVAALFVPPQEPTYWCVAGNFQQSEQEREQLGIDRRHWKYISSPDALRGYDIDPDMVIYTGTWDQRPDLDKLSEALLISTHMHTVRNSRLTNRWERP